MLREECFFNNTWEDPNIEQPFYTTLFFREQRILSKTTEKFIVRRTKIQLKSASDKFNVLLKTFLNKKKKKI